MKWQQVAQKAETDQADGLRSTAKLEHKGHGKGIGAQAGVLHSSNSGWIWVLIGTQLDTTWGESGLE